MERARRPSTQTLELLQGFMEQPRKWQHGYELSKATGLMSGTLYPILMRLSDRGLLEHKWLPSQESGRPPRHVYRLTSKGVAYAKEELASRDEMRAVSKRSMSRA